MDRWDQDGVRFIFGIDAMANLKALAERLPDLTYSELERPPRYTIRTAPRQARERHKERIVSERQFAQVMDLIGSGRAEGARLLTGGGRPSDASLHRGLFVASTVFDGVSPSMRISWGEIFGPVMSVMRWDDYENMPRRPNSSSTV